MNPVVYPSNVVSRRISQATIKTWQWLIVARAGQEIEEKIKEATVDLHATMSKSYHQHAQEIMKIFAEFLPLQISMELLLCSSYNQQTQAVGPALTGNQMWENLWKPN